MDDKEQKKEETKEKEKKDSNFFERIAAFAAGRPIKPTKRMKKYFSVTTSRERGDI
jgi:hypothetical protein